MIPIQQLHLPSLFFCTSKRQAALGAWRYIIGRLRTSHKKKKKQFLQKMANSNMSLQASIIVRPLPFLNATILTAVL